MKLVMIATDRTVAGCYVIDVMASIDKRMMIKTLKQFMQPYVGVSTDNFDVSYQRINA